MLKALAVLRTLFLVFILGFTVRSMPWSLDVAQTFDEQYNRYATAVSALQRACWYAIAWIALETVLGWWLALRKRPPSHAPAPPGAPARQP
jgi:H+/Cl- antiporter ClcA